jgi:signal transduction histidine kinase
VTTVAIGSLVRTHEPAPMQLIERLSGRLTRRSVVPVALAITVIVGIGDRLTGVELPFTLLYVLPIGLAAWYRDRVFGLAVSALATACIGVALLHDGLSSLGIVWNGSGAVLLFFAVSWGVDQLHVYVEQERAQRRMAVDQLRHAERLNVIGTLAAGVAHELGTPLNVIGGCAEMLAEDSDDPTVHRRTSMILDQVSRVSAIIGHLLDFGHRGGVARGDVELGALAAATVDMLQSTAHKRGAEILFEPGPPVHASGNVSELEQVLSNLILNGLQAMERGGTVRVTTCVTSRAGHPAACIVVEDEGHGISAADRPRIFDPFFTTKDVGEGTGLGLSVSYGIVHDHNGSIEVESQPGRGSTFTVVLPLRG